MKNKDNKNLAIAAEGAYNLALFILNELESKNPDFEFIDNMLNVQIEKYKNIKDRINEKVQ